MPKEGSGRGHNPTTKHQRGYKIPGSEDAFKEGKGRREFIAAFPFSESGSEIPDEVKTLPEDLRQNALTLPPLNMKIGPH